jgi:predicted O-methyltransferase YrrM
VSTETVSLSGIVGEYFRAHAFRELPVQTELRLETAKLGSDAQMQIAPEQGAFMGMMAGLMNAKHILEIGTFTGYSSLAMALGAPQAHITAVDVSEEWTAMAQKYWTKARVASRISLRLDGGHKAVADLLGQGRHNSFDLCFLDADKTSYDAYYEGALKLLRPGGLIMIDNVLWGGDVARAEKQDEDTVALRALNSKIKADARVSICMLPIADGLTLARKLGEGSL